MTDESYSFTAAKTRLDEIVTQVRKKDTSLEKSLDLLEEGVRLANVCTELIDHADWASAPGQATAGDESVDHPAGASAAGSDAASEPTEAPDAEATDAEVGVARDDVESDDIESEVAADAGNENADAEAGSDAAIGEVWSEDEAWADEAEDDPSDGDDGHGD